MGPGPGDLGFGFFEDLNPIYNDEDETIEYDQQEYLDAEEEYEPEQYED